MLTRQVWAVPALAVMLACGGGGGGDVVDPPAAVATVTVTLAAPQVFIGQTSQATAVLRDAQGATLTGRQVTWSSSNTAVATVSTGGLVAAVAAGTAAISATSEGKTGQADITVTVDPATQPQIQNVTVTQNGQAANLNQVAGTLSLAFRIQVPNGFNGTLTVKVDTVEYLRETVTAPALAARVLPGTTVQPIVALERTVDINTASTTTVVSSEQIRELPLVSNGQRSALVQLIPSLPPGPSAQQTVGFTANNPPHAHGWFRFDGTPATGTDGRTYTGGAGQGAVTFATYGTEVINEFEVTVTTLGAQYGRTTGGVIDVIDKVTRTNQNFFTINPLLMERANLTMVLSRIIMNGQSIFPQLDFFGNAAFTTDLIGSGLANTPQQAQGAAQAPGKTYLQVHSLPADLFPGTVFGRATIEPFHIDGVGPTQTSPANQPVFGFLDRLTTVGGPAFLPTYGYGARDNQLSARYEYQGGLNLSRLGDITGVNQAQTEYYAGPISDRANLFSLQYKLSASLDLAESSGSRSYTMGARVFDGRGNSSDWTISTTLGNPWNTSGQQSTGGQIGLQEGAFGFTKLRAGLSLSGLPDESVWNSTVLDPTIGWGWTASTSLVGIPDGWLSGRAKLNGTWYLGSGTAEDGFQVFNSTGGASGGTASVTARSLTDAYSTQIPIQQGLYEFDFKAADNAARYIGDMNWPRTRRLFVDYIPPANAQISYSGTVVPGESNSATLLGNDPFGISRFRVGVRYEYGAAVTGNQIYTPLGEFSLPGSLSGSRVTNLNQVITGLVPVGFWFFNPFNGVVDWANLHRSNGGTLELMDFAWNWSSVHFAGFTNTAPAPTLTNVSDVHASLGTTNWCPGTCQAGGNKIVGLNFNYFDDRAMGDPTISKASWFAIPTNGRVQYLGKQSTVTAVPEGLGRRLSYNLSLDLSDYCGPGGSVLVFPIGYAKDGKSSVKAGSFFSATIQTPIRYSNHCNDPPPPLPPPPPPF